ncbi:MAG: RuvX/YqgF family protein [Patescibacteria group bacterium]
MKSLGIDFGEKRIGIALSDESNHFAFPVSVLSNTSAALDEIVNICKKEGVGRIVMGESKDFKGNFNPIMKTVVPFAEDLKKKTGLPFFFEPEFLTSREATHIQGNITQLDASAAALILKHFLDTHHDIN